MPGKGGHLKKRGGRFKKAFILEGVDEVLRNLNEEARKIKKRSKEGVTAACVHIKAESQKLTPVVTGNLRNSAYIDVRETSRGPGGVVGYTAVYALRVHEDAEAERRRQERKGKPHPPGRVRYSTVGQWKFLETPLKRDEGKILELIREYARIKS